ncbi:MAG: cysteine hydrolase family protein [Candidatus Parvarchaeum sp.]
MEKALLLVDLIKGFGQEGYDKNMYCRNVEKIKGSLQQLVEYANKNNIPVIYCCDAHENNDPELKRNGGPWEEHCMKGTESSDIVDWLPSKNLLKLTNTDAKYKIIGKEAQNKMYRIDKRTYSGFYNTVLDELLKNNGIKEVYIAGLVTSICVQHTAADAFFRGYKINIVENGCADTNNEKHENAIEYMKNNYSAKIVEMEKTGLK